MLALGLVAVLPGVAPARAASGSDFARHLRESPQLLGDPGGARSRLAELGLTLQLFANVFGAWKTGGRESGDDLGQSASYDLIALADLQELAGWRGGSFLLHAKGMADRNVNAEVGALSDPIDDADGFDQAIYVDELWLEQAWAEGRLRLRAGFQEQQTIFDRNAYANNEDRQFLATALDNGLVPLPNGLALNVIVEPCTHLALAFGVADADNRPRRSGFDTAFDDLDSLGAWAEATLHVRLPGPGPGRPGSWRLGVFRDGRRKTVFGEVDGASGRPRTARGDLGVYLSVDQELWRQADDRRSLGLFARAAAADPDVNAFPWFLSAGLSLRGALPGRAQDVLGLGAWQLRASHRFRDHVDARADEETGFELYNAAPVLPWLVVTPDLQVILDPGGRDADTAVVVALRLRVAF